MSKAVFLIVLCFVTILSVEANDCSIHISANKNVSKIMELELMKKGYIATSREDAEYTLKVHYGNMMTRTNCFIYAAQVEIMNSGKQIVAEASSEASLFRLTFSKWSIPRATTLRSFKKVIKALPVCE